METSLLKGTRVLDLTRVLAGPFCTLQLADLGAEVVKVENPRGGDDSRFFGPFIEGQSAYFLSLNRNKKSITLNLKDPRGRDLLRQLAASFDILVENFRPGTMERLGLGYETLRKDNPRLVYAAISGFGATGPDRQRPAYDIVIQGRGGLMSVTGEENGAPTRVGASISDITAGLFTLSAILAAYIEVLKTGRGNRIDISMLDCQVAILENAIARYEVSGEVPGPIGNRHPSITPFATFRTADGYIIIAAANNKLWKGLCEVLACPALATDPRFAENALRTANWKDLEEVLVPLVAEKKSAQWLALLEEKGIPCGLVQNVAQLFDDPQVLARNMLRTLPVSEGSQQTMRVAGIPYHFATPPRHHLHPAPTLGQHTEEILELYAGFSPETLNELSQEGVI